MAEVKVTREELYNAVWGRPMRDIARDYHISDVGLRKICVKLDIPLPGAGHWRKIEVGHEVFQPPLSALKPGTPYEHTFYWNEHESPRTLPEEAQKLLAKVKDKSFQIVVGNRLGKMHPLIEQTANALKSGQLSTYGQLTNSSVPHLSIYVTKDYLSRALRIMDALIKALEEINFQVVLENNATFILVFGEKIKITLSENVATGKELPKKHPWSYPVYEYLPTGDFTLKTEDVSADEPIRRKFSDNKTIKIEDQLNRFIAALILSAFAQKAQRLRLEELERKRKEEERARIEAIRRRELKKKRVDDLNGTLADWQLSKSIRQLSKEYNDALSEYDFSEEETEKVKEWISWALKYADEIDPLTKVRELQK